MEADAPEAVVAVEVVPTVTSESSVVLVVLQAMAAASADHQLSLTVVGMVVHHQLTAELPLTVAAPVATVVAAMATQADQAANPPGGKVELSLHCLIAPHR